MHLRRTRESDLDLVLELEGDPDNSPYVGSWSRDQHRAALRTPDREHWMIELVAEQRLLAPQPGPDGSLTSSRPVGYLIAYDLRAAGRGVHIKRIVVHEKGRGIGRRAVAQFSHRALGDLSAPFVWLDVLADNHRAQAAYRAAGFQVLPLDEAECAQWAESVDGFSPGSLVMTCLRPPSLTGG